MFQGVNVTQVALVFAVFTQVLEEARRHDDDDVVDLISAGRVHYWGLRSGTEVLIYANRPLPGQLSWGEVIDTVIAAQSFIWQYHVICSISIYENTEQRTYLATMRMHIRRGER